jgi:glyoxylase-like metal-dependent hydrolase (beta-lactamase superfamily II)
MTLDGTNTYLLSTPEAAYVIDPGPADEGHVARIRALAADRGGVAGVLLTHSHLDHAAAVEMLAAPVLEPGAGPLQALSTPGHSADHVCFISGALCFCGDLVLGSGSTFVPPDGGSLGVYLDSLRAVRALEAEVLCPGHGPYITDPGPRIDQYLEHRLERERKLLGALAVGERSRRRLLDAAWDDVAAELRPAAAIVMQAHLDKLEAEGRLAAGELTE